MIEILMKIYREFAPKEYFWIRRKSKNQRERKAKFMIFTPFLMIISGFNFLVERTIGRVISLRKKLDNKKYEYELVFAGIAKNEGAYIEEWIAYHRIAGVERFVIYDNGSTDDMRERLQPYIDSGIVEYFYFPGRAKQLDAYYDALKRYQKRTRLMGFIDLDEFVVSSVSEGKLVPTILDILKKDTNAAGVAINWYVYGSSGHKTKPAGLVIENYLYRAYRDNEINRCIKTIGNPRLMKGYIFDPHAPTYFYGYYSINECGKRVEGPWNEYPNNSYDKIRINHYYCKSEEEGKVKFERGLATHEQEIKNDWGKYQQYDRNDVYDDIILGYAKEIKEMIIV